jgi:hypothetical protein
MFAKVSQVPMLCDRAKVEISDTITLLDERSVEQIKETAAELSRGYVQREARFSPCGQAVAMSLKDLVWTTTCSGKVGIDCFATAKTDLDKKFDEILRGETCASLSPLELPLELGIRNSFAQLLTAEKKGDFTATKTYINTQLTRITFTAISGVIVKSHDSEGRVKISGGNLTRDPLVGNLTMGAVNIHLLPYDPDTPDMTRRERVRFFAGGVLLPNFGFGGGLGVGIVRGLSINVGYARLFTNTLADGESLNTAPQMTNPFRLSTSGAVFIGAGFTFK